MKKIVAILAVGSFLMSASQISYGNYQPYADIGVGYSSPTAMPAGETFNNLDGVVPEGTASSTATQYGGRLALGILWDTETAVAYGLEAAAALYGIDKYSNESANVEMNYYGLELLGVLQFNLDKLHLIVKGGASDEQLHPTKTNIDNTGLTDSQQVLPEVGAGIAYSFTQNTQLGLSYYHTFGNTVSFNSTGDATNLPSVNMGLLELVVFF